MKTPILITLVLSMVLLTGCSDTEVKEAKCIKDGNNLFCYNGRLCGTYVAENIFLKNINNKNCFMGIYANNFLSLEDSIIGCKGKNCDKLRELGLEESN